MFYKRENNIIINTLEIVKFIRTNKRTGKTWDRGSPCDRTTLHNIFIYTDAWAGDKTALYHSLLFIS